MSALILFLATLIGGWLFPWWWPALIGYIVGFLLLKGPGRAFMAGFIGTALSWAALATYTDWQNHHLLATRIASIFHLPGFLAAIVLTAVLGGLIGGLGAWSGFAMGAYLRPKFKSWFSSKTEI